MKYHTTILTLFASLHLFGQNITFLKTTDKKNLHYLEFSDNNVKVYKMGRYYDKEDIAPAILQTDTLVFKTENEFKGRFYTIIKNETNYTLLSDNGKKYQTAQESEAKVNTELNNAYCVKSHIDLSRKLNNEFPLYHYTFRNGYYAWQKISNRSIDHNEFMLQMDKEIVMVYDSISKKQIAFTKTSDFIVENAAQASYATLKDSISTLPIDYKPRRGYFDRSIYQMVRSNPEYFYKLLLDFPTSKTFIYSAVDRDKDLVNQLKQVQGYDELKKEFLKDYKFGKSMPYRIIGSYVLAIGFIAFLVIAGR